MRRRHPDRHLKAVLVVLLLLLIGGGLLGVHFWQKGDQLSGVTEGTGLEKQTLSYEGKTYTLRDKIDRTLLIGLDKFTVDLSDPDSYLNNQQADFLLLMVVDHANQCFYGIHINRDTMTEIQKLGLGGKRVGSYTGQLALSHTYGSGGRDSCRNTVNAVSKLLFDLPIDHYYSLTMDAIPALNDLVGGVRVHVEDDFSAVDPSIVQGKDVTLHGEQALTFVRARGEMTDKTNINRMARQREYMSGLYKSLSSSMGREGFALRLSTTLADYSVSDLLTDELASMAERLADYRFDGIKTIEGRAVVGSQFMEFYPDEDAMRELVVQSFYSELP